MALWYWRNVKSMPLMITVEFVNGFILYFINYKNILLYINNNSMSIKIWLEYELQ